MQAHREADLRIEIHSHPLIHADNRFQHHLSSQCSLVDASRLADFARLPLIIYLKVSYSVSLWNQLKAKSMPRALFSLVSLFV